MSPVMKCELAKELKIAGFPMPPYQLGIISIRMRTTPDGRMPRDRTA